MRIGNTLNPIPPFMETRRSRLLNLVGEGDGLLRHSLAQLRGLPRGNGDHFDDLKRAREGPEIALRLPS